MKVGEFAADLASSILGVLKPLPTGRYFTEPRHWEKQREVVISYAVLRMVREVRGQVRDYIEALGAAEGVTYRLPTPDEWSWAAMGGQGYAFSGSNELDAVAWHRGNTDQIQPVCTRQRNGFGLCDLSGNAWELTALAPPRLAPDSFAKRGGSWFAWPLDAHVFSRGYVQGYQTTNDGPGFRLVRREPTP